MRINFKKILIVALSTNLFINFININHNIYYSNNVSFSRSTDTFQVSKILAKNPLQSNHLLWKKLVENNPVIGLTVEYKKVLVEYEKLIFIKTNENKSKNFELLKNQIHFKSVEEIENKIKTELNPNFTFDKLNSGLSSLNKKIIKEKLLNFYNFIIASKLLNEKDLIKLYYFISSEFKPDNNYSTLAYVMGNRKMQCVSFSSNWYSIVSKATNNLAFKTGFAAVKQRFATFSHETTHALANFYSLSSNEREVYNTNIQKKWNSKQACDSFLEENFPENKSLNIKTSDVTSSVVEFITNKFNEIHPIIVQDHYNFAYWTGLPSHYGWKNDDEYLAEGFAYLFHTPEEERNKIWEIWYDAILGESSESLINKFYR